MGRHYKQIDRDERMKIEALYTAGYSITEIAKQMNRNYTTIYREIGVEEQRSVTVIGRKEQYIVQTLRR